MFCLRKECEPIRQGFNFYPLSDEGSFGFVFRWKSTTFSCRYSKQKSKWFIEFARAIERAHGIGE